jgi:phage antirepressor YoqD-like protein
MLGVGDSTVRNVLRQNSSVISVITAKIPTAAGIRSASVIPSCSVYALALKLNPRLADKMGAAGANLYMLHLAGYKVTIKEVETPQPTFDRPQTKLDWMRCAIESEERAEAERERAETEKIRAVAAEKLAQELSEHIEENADATAHGNAVSTTSNCRDIGAFGKSLAVPIGRTTFYRLLRTLGFIQAHDAIPYMKHVNSGLFEVIEVVTKLPSGNTRTDPKALITGKGELAVIKAMEKMKKKEEVEVQMEKEVVMVD